MNWICWIVLILLLPQAHFEEQVADEEATDEEVDDDVSISISTTTQCNLKRSTDMDMDIVIAKMAAKAAQEATAANDEQSHAAALASKQVKMQLAEKAKQASKSVQAVVTCKRAYVNALHDELRSAEAFRSQVQTSLQHTECHRQKVEHGIKASSEHIKRLAHLRESLHRNICGGIASLSKLVQAGCDEKRQMIAAAKRRNNRLQSQIDNMRRGCEQIKAAAYQAARAAVEARKKAEAAVERSCQQNNGIQIQRQFD
ncbi:uncharacterized protein LOC133849066 [Drosophila sulfurigaster albostrigata]|uniref:uncharacterized protein LOC133849066 n=1 Tax=Drosophila sulfurigaster albostrigata TaxID=89887 RepID=UPI002D21CD45|nr:uncharacterized protein LOC133849066 [Drosophila sulfurigaster albostrigata]